VQPGAHVGLSVRPERIKLGGGRPSVNTMAGAVSDVVYHGDHLQLVLNADGQALLVKADRGGRPPRIGDRLDVSFAPDDCWVVCG
jgi:putative spermidine/putrescine transport system ATP-binding protein